MRWLKKEDCCVLPLVLQGKWFNMIESGGKKEEYRTSSNVMRQIERWCGEAAINNKYRVVRFHLGYQRDRPAMTFIADMPYSSTCQMQPNWGEPSGFHYVIPLAEEVELV